MSLPEFIKEIRSIINRSYSLDEQIFSMTFFNKGEITFTLYETELPILYNNGDIRVYFDEEMRVNSDFMKEVSDIIKLIEDNVDLLNNI